MGFGPYFIKWVKLLYTDIRSAVLVNGYTSDWFSPSRGVRQGCPLSPLLYVLSIEVLAVGVRAHPDIVGRRLPRVPSPLPVLSLYADDTSIISVSDRATLAVFEVYAKFEAGAGAKLNLSKCEGLWLGAWRNRLDSPVAISWNSVKIKSLGLYIGYGNLDEANWRPRIDAIERCLNSWRSRSLSRFLAKLLSLKPWRFQESGTLPLSFLCPLGFVENLTKLFSISFGLVNETLLLATFWFSVLILVVFRLFPCSSRFTLSFPSG